MKLDEAIVSMQGLICLARVDANHRPSLRETLTGRKDELADILAAMQGAKVEIEQLKRERDEARKAILDFGNDFDFDWKVLTRISELEKVVEAVLAARSAWRALENATEAGTEDECIDCHTKSMLADAALETAIEELAAKEASDEK